jgi:hypothetical protein
VCEVQAFDRGLREVMLGTGRGPERQKQMRDRVAPSVDALVARAQEQGTLRRDLVPPDFPVLQLMVGAVTDHTGQPELWRRYLVILIDGLRAQPGRPTSLPAFDVTDDELQDALTDSSTEQARTRRTSGRSGAERSGRGTPVGRAGGEPVG